MFGSSFHTLDCVVLTQTFEFVSAGSMGKAKAKKKAAKATTGAKLGFEATLWKAADKLRNNMDAAEYKHVVLGLIFLKYISDAFEEKHAALAAEVDQGADPEDADEYRAENIFWVPKEARWTWLQGQAKQPTIGKLIDDAMVAIEKDNRTLKGVLPKNYARKQLSADLKAEFPDMKGFSKRNLELIRKWVLYWNSDELREEQSNATIAKQPVSQLAMKPSIGQQPVAQLVQIPWGHWQVGKRIADNILQGDRASYGKQIVLQLSKDLQDAMAEAGAHNNYAAV